MAAVEAENIKVSELGQWIRARHFERLAKLMEENGYSHIIKKYKTPEDLEDWYEGEIRRLNEQLRDNMDSPREDFIRQEMDTFRGTFHKPVIYSAWDWNQTVEDAMHHAGFATFEEQEIALAEQRKKKW